MGGLSSHSRARHRLARGHSWLTWAVAILLVVWLALVLARPVEMWWNSVSFLGGLPTDKQLDGELAWSVPYQTSEADNEIAFGSWLGEDVVVRGDRGGLVAYDQASGEERWDLIPPEGSFLCGMSPAPVNGAGVAIIARPAELLSGDPADSCDRAVLLDVDSGEEQWTSTLLDAFAVARDAQPWIVGDLVVVKLTGRLYALDLASGEPRWETEQWSIGEDGSLRCTARDLRDRGAEILVFGACDLGSGIFTGTLDPQSGDLTSQNFLTDEDSLSASLLTADPVTVAMEGGPTGLYVFGEQDVRLQEIPGAVEDRELRLRRYRPKPPSNAVGSHSVVAHEGVAYVPTQIDFRMSEYRNTIVAFDLARGERLWSQTLPRQIVHLAGVTNDRLVGIAGVERYNEWGYEDYEVVSFDLTNDGAPSLLGPRASVGADLRLDEAMLHWTGERFFVLPWDPREPADVDAVVAIE